MRTALAAIALRLVARASAGAARSPACDAVTAPRAQAAREGRAPRPAAAPDRDAAHRPAPRQHRRLLGDILPGGERDPGRASSPRTRRPAV